MARATAPLACLAALALQGPVLGQPLPSADAGGPASRAASVRDPALAGSRHAVLASPRLVLPLVASAATSDYGRLSTVLEIANVSDAEARYTVRLLGARGTALPMPVRDGCTSCPLSRSTLEGTVGARDGKRIAIFPVNPPRIGWADVTADPAASLSISAVLRTEGTGGTTGRAGIPPTATYRRAWLYTDNTSGFTTRAILVNPGAEQSQTLQLRYRGFSGSAGTCEASVQLPALGQVVVETAEALACSSGSQGLLEINGQGGFIGIALVSPGEDGGIFTRPLFAYPALAMLEQWRVASGTVTFGSNTSAGCVAVSNTAIDGTAHTVHTSKWQRRADASSPWTDIAGTGRTGMVCAYTPPASESGQYRGVAEISIGDERAMHASSILTVRASPGTSDSQPGFGSASVGNRTYTAGTAISPLALPAASGGDGTLSYSLSPSVPGLTFNAATRALAGTPTTAGTYSMTYTVRDAGGDVATLSFTVVIRTMTTVDSVVAIPDTVLRAAIEAHLGKARGTAIFKREMETLKTLDPGWLNDIGGIRSLEGLQFATNLEKLRLVSNLHTVPTPDLSPLAGLTKLTRLNLHAFNNVEGPVPLNLAPLGGLINLSWLDLSWNNITDISPLEGLARLSWLSIRVNRISDIAALAEMPELARLDASENQIARIESLRGLAALNSVLLFSNEISDLAPLAANPGLASGDLVDVRRNPLSIASTGIHIPSLRARGVDVRFSDVVAFESPQTYNDNVFVLPVSERMDAIEAHPHSYVDRVLEYFGDVFDFVIFVPNGQGTRATFGARQNSVEGIGRPVRETGGRLQGVINMGGIAVVRSALLEEGVSIIREGPLLHELMHRWANYVIPTSYGTHWGFSSANGILGGFDLADLVDHGGGRYSAGHFTVAGVAANFSAYAPLELYLAGFVPPEEVPDLWVAEDGAFLFNDDGMPVVAGNGYRMFTATRVRPYTIGDIIAEHGARVPDSRNAQRDFRAVVVLLVNEQNPATRLLLDGISRDVSWFGNRADDEDPRIYNFYEATGGRATITLDGLDR